MCRQPDVLEVLMSRTQVKSDAATEASRAPAVPMRLEVVVIAVADVDRAKAFYEGLGWLLDADVAGGDDYRVVQLTPSGSYASIIFGRGITSKSGSIESLLLAVDDIDAARNELLARGVDVSEVFHDAGGGLGGGWHPGTEGRAPGRDPEGGSYGSYASSNDPDGNRWLLQEITERLPGRGVSDGRCGSRTALEGDGRASRLVREGRPAARLVGLVRRLHGRPAGRRHSG
jgi:catechol 2,3-dioxygenase-like lactoylglutathione lyase family enzyme